jgi:hypothetical protein
VLRDHDTKFSHGLDDVVRSRGGDVLVAPVRAPKANAYAERWVRTVRTECLDWLLIVGRGHLDHLGQDHRGTVRRRDLLGGLLHEYRRAA